MPTYRRDFIAYFASVGLSSTLLPGVLWAKAQESKSQKITTAMLKDAALIAGLEFSEAELEQMLDGVNQNLQRYDELRKITLDNSVAPPLYFNPIVPGMKIDRTKACTARKRCSHSRKPTRMRRIGI